jgi:muconolactone D-isomerase
MLYHLDFHVEYPDNMNQQELFALWSEEADVALQAKEAGIVVDLWKCVGLVVYLSLLMFPLQTH